jgi:hypothetical protein
VENLLTGLSKVEGTVSQICKLTYLPVSVMTLFVVNSTPTVTVYCYLNYPFI